MRKLMVRTWFGPLPEWHDQFMAHVEHLKKFGWEFLVVNNYDWYVNEVELQLGVTLPPESTIDKRKCGDWDPYIGAIFQTHIKTGRFDYWGHFNLDAVYGRIDRWLPDNFLDMIDIFGNDPGAICGPFSVYRNMRTVNELFQEVPNWMENLQSPKFCGWDELDFSRAVVRASLEGVVRFASGFFTAHDHMTDAHRKRQEVRINEDGSLIDLVSGKEIMLYHFNTKRVWPVVK